MPGDGAAPGVGDPGPQSRSVSTGQGELDVFNVERGSDRAAQGADSWWWSVVTSAIETLAATGIPFAVDEVRDLGVPEPDHGNRWGGAFIAASNRGLIQGVGYRRSRRTSRAGGVVRVWQGQ